MENSSYRKPPYPLHAIVVGAPPNSGKSILTYNLSQALRHRKVEVPHYVFRASTDGEGDWLYESNPGEIDVRQLRGKWTDRFRELTSRDIKYRYTPLIVDMGGLPTDKDNPIIGACTHSILITKDVTNNDEARKGIETWRNSFATNNVPLFAEIHSQQSGSSEIESRDPIFKGSIIMQERQDRISGDVFEALVDRIATLFGAFPVQELEKWHLELVQGYEIVNLPRMLPKIYRPAKDWTPNMIVPLLSRLPRGKPLAVYGRGPAWIYGALAIHAPDQAFLQFDPRYGWIKPALIQSGIPTEASIFKLKPQPQGGRYMLDVQLPGYYLDYETETNALFFPDPPPDYGVIISGKLPLWLFTALARFYVEKNVPWLALRSASKNRAIVVHTQKGPYGIGHEVPLPQDRIK